MIPPHIHEAVIRRGTPEQAAAARRQLRLGAALQIKRARAMNATLEQTPGVRTRRTYDAQGTETRPVTPSRGEGDGPSSEVEVNEAHDGAGETWRLLRERVGRDSLDNAGLVLISTVDWDQMDNAYWDGEAMTYGRGQMFNRFTADPTVCGHELGHGVIQYAWGAIYYGEAGALHEHGADVIGSLVEQHTKGQDVRDADWLIGAELLAGTGIRGRALRDMLNPGTAYDDPLIGTDPQPAHYRDRYQGGQDSGGVHINSGIGNRAYVLAARALGGAAWEHVGKLWLQYAMPDASPTITYPEWAARTVALARAHFTTDVADAVRAGWAAVGLDVDAPAPPDELPSDCPPEIKAALIRLAASPEGRLLVGWGRKLAAAAGPREGSP